MTYRTQDQDLHGCVGDGPSRRNVLTTARPAGAALTAVGAAAGPAIAKPFISASGLDLSDPNDLLTASIKLRGTLDDRLQMGWLKAIRYSVMGSEVKPLFGLSAGTFSLFNREEDGSFRRKSFELTFYTDLETGDILETFKMPYTDKTVTVPQVKLGPSLNFYRPLLNDVEEIADMGGNEGDSNEVMAVQGSAVIRTQMQPAVVMGDIIRIGHAMQAELSLPGPGNYKTRYNEMLTHTGSWSEVSDPDLPSAAVNTQYTSVTSWRPWMEMGDLDGHTTAHGWGGKAFRVEDLPADYVEFSRRYYPEEFNDPMAVLNRI